MIDQRGSPPRFVDVHHHLVPSAMRRSLDHDGPDDDGARQRLLHLCRTMPDLESVHSRAAALIEAGGLAVLSMPPGPRVPAGEPATLARDCNDELIAAVRSTDAFHSAMVSIPLPDVDAAVVEIERVGGDPAVSGVMVYTTLRDWTLDETRFEPVYRAIACRRLPLFVHPALEPLIHATASWALRSSIEPILSSTIGAARLMLSGMLDRVPDLMLIIPHLGGVLPYLGQRLVDQSGRGDAEHDVLHYLRTRAYLDTCSFHQPALRCAIETVGADRLLLGSDWPLRGPSSRCVDDITGAGLPDDEVEGILRGNALRLFASRDEKVGGATR